VLTLSVSAVSAASLLAGLATYHHPTLEDLALGAPNPLPLADLEDAVGAPRDLLARVARRRQALPAHLVQPIAALLGVQPGEVVGAAGAVLGLPATARVGLGAGRTVVLGPRALSPYPPDRLLGDPLYPRPLRATAPVVFPGA